MKPVDFLSNTLLKTKDSTDIPCEHVGSEEEEPDPDVDLHEDHMSSLRKQAQLPELPDDGLPSASAQKMMHLASIEHKNTCCNIYIYVIYYI